LEESNQTVDISAFSEHLDTLKGVPIVTAVTAFDDPNDRTTYILILGQAIYMGDKMNHSLICPNQLRARGLIVEDCPQHLSPRDRPSTHSIYDPDNNFRIPLSLKGVTSYFTTRTPTPLEIESCKWIILSDERNWDPHSEAFSELEENFVHFVQYEREHGPEPDQNLFQVISRLKPKANYTSDMEQLSPIFDDKHIISLASTSTSSRLHYSAKELASSWGIGIEQAKKTLKCTTQIGMRNTLHPIERRFKIRQSQLHYSQLTGRHGKFYTDTLVFQLSHN
jgi:hypothetical protein